jgi:hypothetical protein
MGIFGFCDPVFYLRIVWSLGDHLRALVGRYDPLEVSCQVCRRLAITRRAVPGYVPKSHDGRQEGEQVVRIGRAQVSVLGRLSGEGVGVHREWCLTFGGLLLHRHGSPPLFVFRITMMPDGASLRRTPEDASSMAPVKGTFPARLTGLVSPCALDEQVGGHGVWVKHLLRTLEPRHGQGVGVKQRGCSWWLERRGCARRTPRARGRSQRGPGVRSGLVRLLQRPRWERLGRAADTCSRLAKRRSTLCQVGVLYTSL